MNKGRFQLQAMKPLEGQEEVQNYTGSVANINQISYLHALPEIDWRYAAEQRRILVRNNRRFRQEVDIKAIYPYLNEQGLLSDHERDILQNHYHTRQFKIDKLLQWIPMKGDDAVDMFVYCLRRSSHEAIIHKELADLFQHNQGIKQLIPTQPPALAVTKGKSSPMRQPFTVEIIMFGLSEQDGEPIMCFLTRIIHDIACITLAALYSNATGSVHCLSCKPPSCLVHN